MTLSSWVNTQFDSHKAIYHQVLVTTHILAWFHYSVPIGTQELAKLKCYFYVNGDVYVSQLGTSHRITLRATVMRESIPFDNTISLFL
jgi:hypothetical protein